MKYQVAIIGGGPAGYTAAETAGKGGLSVVLFEKKNLGGVCLNEGCIPTKTLLYSAKTYDAVKNAAKYAVSTGDVSFELPKIIARKQKVVRKLVLGVKGKLTKQGVTVVQGEAVIIDQNTIACGGEVYSCDHLIICTGSETFIPPISGLNAIPFWTHYEALENKEVPVSLVIVGGGVIGMEFAAFFNSLGVQVTVIEMLDEILGGMDRELSALLRAEYTKKGVKFMLDTKVLSVSKHLISSDGTNTFSLSEGEKEGLQKAQNDRVDSNGEEQSEASLVQVTYGNADGSTGSLVAEKLLMSVGRRPVTRGFGLENLSLEKTERGNLFVDKQMQTSLAGVYVCGNLTGHSLLAHTAIREAEVAVHNILGESDEMSYRAIPGVVYTNPEFAGVGETEQSLQAKGLNYRVVQLPMAYSGRFVAENEGGNGVCKLLLGEGDAILGVHLLGNPASELITLAAMAIELNLNVKEWGRMIFPHPTVGEIFKEALEL